MLQPVIAATTVQCDAKGLKFVCNVKPDVPEWLIGDGKRLRQILSNLLSNACKFTHEGTIEMEASAEGQREEQFSLVVHVRDTGIGIAPEQIARMFGDFEQADHNGSRHYEGTGLGLAICLRLAHLLGGHLDATSKLGEGSDFRVSLPMRLAPAPVAEMESSLRAAASEPLGARRLRILAAEDNRINRLLLGKILEVAGHQVEFAEDGIQTLRLWQDGKFDLLFMDLQMPGMDGVETAKEIRRREAGNGARIPIIAVTARAMNEDRELAIAAGMDGYIAKPYAAEEILAVVAKVGSSSNGGAVH